MICLRTLGGVELTGEDGRELRAVLAQPKRFALLAYLALARPRGFRRRDELLGIFWPELDAERARRALGQAVHFLRRALGSDVIVSRGTAELGLAGGAAWCDAVALEEALDTGRADDALALYRGDLLVGFFLSDAPPFEHWLETERARLRRRTADAALSLADALAQGSNPAGAAPVLQQAAAILPHDEAVLRRLLAALDAAGDRAGALEAYETFAARLREDLDVAPAPETAAAAAAIRARSAPRPEREAPLVTAPSTDGPAPQRDASAPPASPRGEGRRYVAGAAAGIVLTGLLAFVWLRASQPTPPPPEAIAVTPLAPAVADTALARLGRDLAITLSASLDGVGDVATVDGLTILAQVRPDAPPLALEDALALGRRLGAGRVLHGTLVRSGSRVRADAALYRVADRSVVARASVTALPEDLATLTDSLAWPLLAGVLAAASPTPAARPTASIAALRAYLEGQRAIAEGRWRHAPAHFARAIAADSTFWLAYWRYAYSRAYRSEPVEAGIVAAVLAHRFELPELDRLMIEATLLSDSLSDRLSRGRRVVERFPTSWVAWFDYADQLVHNAPFLGYTGADARAALEQAAALNPDDPTVWRHLFWLAAAEWDTAGTGDALRQLTRLGRDSASLRETGLSEVLFFRYVDRLARSGGAPQPPLADTLAESLQGYAGPIGPEGLAAGVALYGFHRSQIDLAARAIAGGRLPPPIDAALRRSIMLGWAGRGAWDSAMAAGHRYAAAAPGYEPALHVYRLAVVGEWLGTLSGDAAIPWREELERRRGAIPPPHLLELAWLEGMRAVAREDSAALTAARRRLQSLMAEDTAIGRILDRSLAAFATARRGDTVAAATAMADLERERAERYWFRRVGVWHPYLSAVNRLAGSRWLVAAGDTAAAARLLTWQEAVQFPAQNAAHADAALSAVAYYERARIAELIGRTAEARLSYEQFLRRYDLAPPAHRHMLLRAHEALEELRHEGALPGNRP